MLNLTCSKSLNLIHLINSKLRVYLCIYESVCVYVYLSMFVCISYNTPSSVVVLYMYEPEGTKCPDHIYQPEHEEVVL